jgi:predicted alpha/beta superfamily hydrolase
MKNLLLIWLSAVGLTASAQTKLPVGTKPFLLGVIDELQSSVLNEKRILNIYLPEGYNAADTTHYPVIYLLDGSSDEDFIHVVGLVQFNSFEWINRLPKSIVVGIANVDRQRDFTYPTTVVKDRKAYPTTGKSANFISFVGKELQPYIETKYKTTKSRTLIGESLGGLVATEILLKEPELFNNYIIVSPSLWWDNGSLLNEKLDPAAKAIPANTKVYIGVGKEGVIPGNPPRVMEVDANVLADGVRSANKNIHVYFDYLPEENHATIMHQALINAFKLLNPTPKKD